MDVESKINDIIKKAKNKVRELITNDTSLSDEHDFSADLNANQADESRKTLFLGDSDEKDDTVHLQEINEEEPEFHVDFEIGFSESLDVIE